MKESIFAKAKKARENKKGFTLVELIVVLVILAILAAILVPALLGWIDKAKEKQVVLEGRVVMMAAQTAASAQYGTIKPEVKNITVDEILGYINGDAPGTWTVTIDGTYKVTNVVYASADKKTVVTWTKEKGWLKEGTAPAANAVNPTT